MEYYFFSTFNSWCFFLFSFITRDVYFTILLDTVKKFCKSSNDGGEKYLSSIQAFTVGLSSRIGTGRFVGVIKLIISDAFTSQAVPDGQLVELLLLI
ncbi:MAG: hypothetical protein ACRC5R_01210 [Mycoplasmatales bacterium]